MIVAVNCKTCGRHPVKALFFAGGLAITPYHGEECKDDERLVRITHIDSGLALGDPVPFERARTALLRLLEITDWRRPSIAQEVRGPDRAWICNARDVIRAFLHEHD